MKTGNRTMNSLPLPMPWLRVSTWPRCNSTRLLTKAKPMPKPPSARSSDLSACVNKSKMFGSTSGAMPMPSSHTRTVAHSWLRSTTTPMWPPALLYLEALFSRLPMTCSKRAASASIHTGPSAKLTISFWLRRSMLGVIRSTDPLTMPFKSTRSKCKAMRPVVMRETSSRSSVSLDRCRTCRSMTQRASMLQIGFVVFLPDQLQRR